jgi:hypothetical protein
MVEPFPSFERELNRKGDEDFNPAIQLFGRRFFNDQTTSELLLEFMLVATSIKRIQRHEIAREMLLPDLELLRSWPDGARLEYAPKARLNLKLFAFINGSKLETRHETHREHYRELISRLTAPERLVISGAIEPDDVLRTLENLLVGFQSVGGDRTWCAQAFLPVARNLIGAETLWNETDAKRAAVRDWSDVVERFLHFFSFGRHRFLARGGELLYLQLCNALRIDTTAAQAWLNNVGVGFSGIESNTDALHVALGEALLSVFSGSPGTIDDLAHFIDSCVETTTSKKTDIDAKTNEPRFMSCGWCPAESWREGILFAIELLRLCRAVIDPIERLELLEIACAMQVLRSLCAQAARYTPQSKEATGASGPLGYVWAISDPAGGHVAVKQISRRNVNAVQRLIYDALRDPRIRSLYDDRDPREVDSVYADADRRYGHKLFLTVAKRLGLITPRRGGNARFVLNDRLLRYLVLSTIRPGERVTYESFKKLLFAHHGLAVDDHAIGQSCLWSGTSPLTTLGGKADEWLLQMLNASGVLVRLSDACSLVMNPFGGDPAA